MPVELNREVSLGDIGVCYVLCGGSAGRMAT